MLEALVRTEESRGKDVQLGEAVAALNEAAVCKKAFAEVPALSCFAELFSFTGQTRQCNAAH